MYRPTVAELAEIIEMHRKWLQSESGGKRAEIVRWNLRGSNLSGSDLRGSDLRGSDLRGSDLSGSDLRGSDLSGSDLRGSDLRGSDLRGSDLSGSDLRGSNLRGSDLRGSDLRGSDLSGSDLSDSNLSGSDLSDSDLSGIRDDIWAVLSSAPAEVGGLRQAIVDGKIDGSQYEGECACLVGTIANVRHCSYGSVPMLKPDSSRPAEVWFLNIKPGDTPQNNQFAALALEWITDWQTRMKAAFGPTPTPDHPTAPPVDPNAQVVALLPALIDTAQEIVFEGCRGYVVGIEELDEVHEALTGTPPAPATPAQRDPSPIADARREFEAAAVEYFEKREKWFASSDPDYVLRTATYEADKKTRELLTAGQALEAEAAAQRGEGEAS